jgi:hypothetical protein
MRDRCGSNTPSLFFLTGFGEAMRGAFCGQTKVGVDRVVISGTAASRTNAPFS